MRDMQDRVTLKGCQSCLILSCMAGQPLKVLYWGKVLSPASAAMIERLTERQHAPGGPEAEIEASFLNETGLGLSAGDGFSAHRSGRDWSASFKVETVHLSGAHSVRIICHDLNTQISAAHSLTLDPDRDILSLQTEITNLGRGPLSLLNCVAACLPLDARAERLFGFAGRWAGEFQKEDIPGFTGSYLRENTSGRTSHHSFPGLLAGHKETTEQTGHAYGVHLAWSGNHRLRLDTLADGRRFIQAGEAFYPGEIELASGAIYQSPVLYAGYSGHGYSGLSRQFHTHLKTHILDKRRDTKPRPIHFNSWEAVYFQQDEARLISLAERAAEIGIERFILDDGWFSTRRDDTSGLGDWHVSKNVYPNGLQPLCDKIIALGMEFGLWFEPEMVNPDSVLYRAHPDWVLQADGLPQIASRGQYVLDLTRSEVQAYLYESISALLDAYPIGYIKWDMNRDIQHPGSHGRAVASAQTRAVYALLERLRRAYPALEIESCSSGGGRADYGILSYTDRIWTSDNNDALERQAIQRGASHFFPLDVLGTHVGPSPCHITGRRLSMNLRVISAFWGHMGVEANLLKENPQDLAILKAGIALHKRYRPLLHGGDFLRLETPAHINALGVVAPDKKEALFSWTNLSSHKETLPGRLYMADLNPDLDYRTRILWPQSVRSVSAPSIIDRADLAAKGYVFTGEALMQIGLQVPLLLPETGLIFHVQAE